MPHCPGCSAALAASDHTCPGCGVPVEGSSAPTVVEDRGRRPRPVRPRESEPLGFPPGDLLAGRYRVVNLIGRGGMGEVYRVEDLKLGQTVALKFLPEWLASDGAALARFHREVSLARQVSHPNVCRVFDVGEARGRPFLSMEHIDGEDLSLLLRRIGRLPADRAIGIALQLCGGLAAIHDAGVLHRDLKPSNVMIDARGRARITDFGVAALAGELRAGEARAGTLAYMAPEQAASGEVSVRSDLYSLGLVLYEMCTGQRPFEGPVLVDPTRSPMRARPVAPSNLAADIHPLVERAILRCLERDPRDRPPSAVAVARALPGGDLLAAALAAGETPSPEMVAAVPKQGSLRPAVAGACLAGVLLCLAGIVAVSSKVMAFRQVPLPHSPEVLADRAGSLLASLGYPQAPADRAYGFELHRGYHESLRARGRSGKAAGGPPLYLFWYRQSPGRVTRTGLLVGPQDPPRAPGEAYVALTPEGRLYRLEIVPDRNAAPAGPGPPPDWPALLRAAGLEPARLSPIPPFRPP
ncbi:MAG TPA: serine/threonine-protein kinase, partial [Thermoanaerobaculia bacterium]